MTGLDLPSLNKALADPPFTAADRAMVRYLRADLDELNPWVLLAAALASAAARDGHAYLDLEDPQIYHRSVLRSAHSWPELSSWSRWLAESSATGDASSPLPLVAADDKALYLKKYFDHEQALARLILEKARVQPAPDSKYEVSSDPALAQAVSNRLFVVTGGPGTGKTTLAMRYLDTFVSAWRGRLPPRIAAIAPTGKAAARLSESIGKGAADLDASDQRKSFLRKTPCITIHRLLGALPNRPSFRRNHRNPVDYDVLVVDESSMIDLPLMRRLFEAVPIDCSILLLGDRDQLSSVEVGSVLTDVLKAAEDEGTALHDKTHRLTKTYRFSEDSSIYRCCEAARRGDGDAFSELLDSKAEDFSFNAISAASRRLPKSLTASALRRHSQLLRAGSPTEALARLNRSIILSPAKVGPFGSYAINAEVERAVRSQEQTPDHQPIPALPVIVLENSYDLELFNGDLGVVWLDEKGQPYGWFNGPDGKPRKFRLSELPRHESAFALTIHKSQGSEFGETIGVFGPNMPVAASRELLYTCFSRAKKILRIFGNRETLLDAIANQARRATRLSELLRS